MGLIQAIVLGIVQGLTEFLPISSSGHLFLVSNLIGWRDAGAGFTAVIQLGTLAAVWLYFRKDLAATFRGFFAGVSDRSKRGGPEFRMFAAVAVGTVPIVLAGLLLESKIEHEFRSTLVIVTALIVLGLVLYGAERAGRQDRGIETVSLKDGIVVGLWQCLSLVPGSSRSGSTITGALFSGLERSAAARFSFLLSVPAVALSGLYKLFKERDTLLDEGASATIVATVVSFVVGLWAISFLMKYLENRTTTAFVVYRVALGLAILGLALGGLIPMSAPGQAPAAQSHEAVQEAKGY